MSQPYFPPDRACIARLEAFRDRQRSGQPPAPEPMNPNRLPEGSVVLSAGEWQAVMHLVETHPETKDALR